VTDTIALHDCEQRSLYLPDRGVRPWAPARRPRPQRRRRNGAQLIRVCVVVWLCECRESGVVCRVSGVGCRVSCVSCVVCRVSCTVRRASCVACVACVCANERRATRESECVSTSRVVVAVPWARADGDRRKTIVTAHHGTRGVRVNTAAAERTLDNLSSSRRSSHFVCLKKLFVCVREEEET
jgi:hypothetical protein